MDKAKFDAIFPIITAHLTDKIAKENKLPENAAISELYRSALYAALEKEETKVWQYSTEKLYELYLGEKQTGRLELPEY